MRISDWSSDVCSSDLVGFISKTEFGTIPTREHENSGEDPICILDELVEHLADGHICVVMEVGSEKSCYVTGNAFAISSTGESIQIGLDDIYNAAREKFEIGRASCRERVCQYV